MNECLHLQNLDKSESMFVVECSKNSLTGPLPRGIEVNEEAELMQSRVCF